MARHEKTKSGGLFDTFFSRPKKGQRMHHSQEVNNDITNMDDLTTEIQSWDREEVNAKFLDILEDMNIPADKRDPLLSKDINEKRAMLLMHYKGAADNFINVFFFVFCYIHFNILFLFDCVAFYYFAL